MCACGEGKAEGEGEEEKEREQTFCRISPSLYKDSILIMRAPPSRPPTSFMAPQMPHQQIPPCWKLGLEHMKFGDTQSVRNICILLVGGGNTPYIPYGTRLCLAFSTYSRKLSNWMMHGKDSKPSERLIQFLYNPTQ